MATAAAQARWRAGHREEYNAYQRDYQRKRYRDLHPKRPPLNMAQLIALGDIRALHGWTSAERAVLPSELEP